MKKWLYGALLVAASFCAQQSFAAKPDMRVICFYYNWYGNTEYNGKEVHWGHGVIGNKDYNGPADYIPGGVNVAANFYPEQKNYSSTDPKLIARHVTMMADARIGVVCVTWWGDNDFGTPGLKTLFDEAAKRDMKVCFHIEPYSNRNPENIRTNIAKLIAKYGSHPAFYRMNGKPCFFIYDSYITPASEWARLLKPDGDITIRGTKLDAVMIGLWVKQHEEQYFLDSGLDGFYTYFAATGFTPGSTPANWKNMEQWARNNGKIFIPSVGPGYIDTRVRPWNGNTIRDRQQGKYYDNMFRAAIDCKAPYISITSFNEWHEGTQIEPAIPFSCEAFSYLDYSPLAPDYYLKSTAQLISTWKK
ncbi:MAG: alpha-mannosidase [Alistipes sp.]